MDHPVIAIYDANVLYPAPLRDLFIRLAQAGLVRARWMEAIHDEWVRNVLNDNQALSPDRFSRTRGADERGRPYQGRSSGFRRCGGHQPENACPATRLASQ
jgi:hypothetical protein